MNEEKNKSLKLNFFDGHHPNNVIVYIPIDNVPVCFQNTPSSGNRKGIVGDIDYHIFFDVCAAGYSYIWNQSVCGG